MQSIRRPILAGILLLVACPAQSTALVAADKAAPQANQPEKKAPQAEPENKVSEFMRSKLDSAQNILEGLTVEDYDLIKKGCDNLIVMSKAAEWQIIHGPVYAQDSNEFRQATSHLKKMAEAESLDGAVLAYLRVTMSCVNCHKHVRASKIARIDAMPLEQFAATQQLVPNLSVPRTIAAD